MNNENTKITYSQVRADAEFIKIISNCPRTLADQKTWFAYFCVFCRESYFIRLVRGSLHHSENDLTLSRRSHSLHQKSMDIGEINPGITRRDIGQPCDQKACDQKTRAQQAGAEKAGAHKNGAQKEGVGSQGLQQPGLTRLRLRRPGLTTLGLKKRAWAHKALCPKGLDSKSEGSQGCGAQNAKRVRGIVWKLNVRFIGHCRADFIWKTTLANLIFKLWWSENNWCLRAL